MRSSNPLIVLAICLLLSGVGRSLFSSDKVNVSTIPGFPETNFTVHAGYESLASLSTQELYYIFLESQNDPHNDPIIVWNGAGRCCSSLYGLFYENGPWVFEPNTTTLVTNDYSWNKNANVIYFENPTGVGFSKASGTTDEKHNDHDSALDIIEALTRLLQETHRSFLGNDIYIAGEHYAGIEALWIAFFDNALSGVVPFIENLKGIIVGNPLTVSGYLVSRQAQVEYLYAHAFLNDSTYNDYIDNCDTFPDSYDCNEKYLSIQEALNGLNPHNIYAQCYEHTSSTDFGFKHKEEKPTGMIQLDREYENCFDTVGINTLMNSDDFRDAFHVKSSVGEWTPCDLECSGSYETDYVLGSYWAYPFIMNRGIRFLVYSGDLDALVPITDTVEWITELQAELQLTTTTDYAPWYVDGEIPNEPQQAGDYWALENITFYSIKGAGGMAPMDKRSETLQMLTYFLQEEDPRLEV